MVWRSGGSRKASSNAGVSRGDGEACGGIGARVTTHAATPGFGLPARGSHKHTLPVDMIFTAATVSIDTIEISAYSSGSTCVSRAHVALPSDYYGTENTWRIMRHYRGSDQLGKCRQIHSKAIDCMYDVMSNSICSLAGLHSDKQCLDNTPTPFSGAND